jgi:hypothetical protein
MSTLCRRRKTLEELASKSTDDLAPSLGYVISAITGNRLSGFADPTLFIRITYPTETLRSIIRDVTDAITSGKTYTLLLNLDMGSGKTHLLTLLYHLFYTLPCLYSPNNPAITGEIRARLREFDPDYDFIGSGHKPVVVLPLDFGAKNFSEQVSTWAASLECIGDASTAKELRDYLNKGCIDSTIYDCLPNALDFAAKINNKAGVILLIDEFYYGVQEVAQGSANAELITRLLDFIRTFIDRRGAVVAKYGSAIITLIAGARSYYDWWQENRGRVYKSLVDKVEFFEKRINRIVSQPETKWLNIDDAMSVICTRLGLNAHECSEVFHENFRDFVGRVIKADTDFPNAQHLRGLIKASAEFALNACNLGDSRITPAHFNERVIDALMPNTPLATTSLATMYKSNYDVIINYVKKLASNNVEESILKYMVNAIFAGSIVGDARKLIFALRGSKEVVLSTESWVRRSIEPILEEKKYPSNILNTIMPELGSLPYIREVSVGNEVVYVVWPYINPKTRLYDSIEGNRRDYLSKKDIEKIGIVKRELSSIISRIGNALEWVEFRITDKLSELCKEGRLGSIQNKLLVVITINDDEHEIEESIKCLTSKVIMPVVVKFNLSNDAYNLFVEYISRYKALLDLKESLDNEYLRDVGRELVQVIGEQYDRELEQRLIDGIKKDYVDMANDEMKTALNKLMKSIAIMLGNIYYYEHVSVTVKTYNITNQLLNTIKSTETKAMVRNYERAKEELDQSVISNSDNLFMNYAESIAKIVGYEFKYNDALVKAYMDEVMKYIDEGNEYQVPKDIPMVFIGNQQFIFYRPVYDKFLNELKKEIQERYGDKIEIIEDQSAIRFNVKRMSKETVEVGTPTTGGIISEGTVQQLPVQSFDDISGFINAIKSPDNIALITLTLRIKVSSGNEASQAITILNMSRNSVESAYAELRDGRKISYRKPEPT